VRIGRITYLNVFPYYHALDLERWGPFVAETPRQLGELARGGRLDAAPLPLVDAFELEAEFEPLADWGIACRGPVQSVLLFSRRPFAALSGSRLVFTGESATSVVLARQLLEGAGNGDVEIERGDDPSGYDGYLAIGDRALLLDRTHPFEHCHDLSDLWFEQTGLPFVFARWVVRRTLSRGEKDEFAAALAHSIATPLPAEIPNEAGLSADRARAYLANIIYRLDEACHQGAALFRSRLHACV
jgi:chorismate dehydratase